MSTDPTALAREVLEREERLSAYTYSIPLAAQASWDATRSEQVKAAPDLARAVIELTARLDAERFAHANAAMRIKCVKALADELEAEGTAGVRVPNRTPHDSGWHDSQIIAAARIRTALNGENA